ncbi:hypothetical protein C7444_101226 [Sphaerotilus hippei]|uniref:CorA-like Mg2+ transporter protein n=1 Tax=Sphaerotilus hippei TaxID=744406 RepID=A0A318H5Q5_9BURK|nr:hypothetical protein [Sphaerotilus hippei]PXW99396.1 hypothetical protein C7444_101226 [Sphaerotilus hippei]
MSSCTVRHFHQSLLWPLQLMPGEGARRLEPPWQVLLQAGGPWREVHDEFTGDHRDFHERHYNEFVTFLPFVQRFLYGDGTARGARGRTGGSSSMRVLRRDDVRAVRLQLAEGEPAFELQVEQVDLYFFHDVDVILLQVAVQGHDLPLARVQELLYRFGRGYPPGWDGQGRGLHCPAAVAWLDAAGQALAASDAGDREAFLGFVGRHRAPRLAAHWRWLLQPLIPDHEEEAGALRFRQIEYHRMPVMAYLALDEPAALQRADFVRLGLVSGQGDGAEAAVSTADDDDAWTGAGELPFAEQHLADFEQRHCYDRFWCRRGAAPQTRYLCCGHALVVVGRADAAFFTDAERGVLAQFRHQHFLLFLIAHFQKAALLMFSDRLVVALDALSIADADSVKRFKRAVRANFENFLRFTHRYWFHDISEQVQTRALHRLCVEHLGLETLYREVRERVGEMNTYLDTDSLRRQANTVVRLTVVTIAGLIGTLSTGFLGMNLLAEAEAPWSRRAAIFGFTLLAALLVTGYTIVKSKRLSDFLDVLSDERLSLAEKFGAWRSVWRHEGG